MYALIRTYDGGNDFADVLIEREEDIRDVIGSIDGFRGYYLIRAPQGPITISVFENQESAEASSSAAAEYITDNLLDVSPASPHVSGGEIALSFASSLSHS